MLFRRRITPSSALLSLWCFFFYVLLSHSTSEALYSFPTNELNALKDLYLSTHGSSWKWKYPLTIYGNVWNFTTTATVTQINPCIDNWQGITCTSKCTTSQCNVKVIQLVDYDLNGTLPLSLNSFTHLTILEIALNDKLHGSIPSTITDIVTLQSLYLDSNRLTGSLPNTINSLINLQIFDLQNNANLTYSLSLSVCQLHSLTLLNMNHNHFTGSLPACIGELTALTSLTMVSNHFMGSLPESILSLTKLTTYEISDNAFTGTIPSEIGNAFRRCTIFSLEQNQFTGTLPASIGNMTSLSKLYLIENQFEGSLPNEIVTQCRNMTEFEISENLFTGSLCEESFLDWKHLTTLALSINFFTGSLPASLFQLSSLKTLTLNNNSFSGNLSAMDDGFTADFSSTSGGLTSLSSLQLSYNFLTSSLPTNLLTISSSLAIVEVDHNLFTGTLPFDVDNGTLSFSLTTSHSLTPVRSLTPSTSSSSSSISLSLTDMWFSFNFFTGTLSPTICQLPSLKQFEVQSCFLTGTIPSSIGLLSTSLSQLYLDDNLLTGSIPQSFTNLSSLLVVSVDRNRMNGSLPQDWSNMTRLQSISLYENRFTGSIPLSLITSCKSLTILNFFDNLFTGSLLPSSSFNTSESESGGNDPWTSLNRLYYINLNDNHFTGTLPTGLFTNKPLLVTVYLASNMFSGSIPDVITTDCPSLYGLNLGFNQLTGSLPKNIGHILPLNQVYLMGNELTGSIPDSLFTLQDLVLLYLFHNQMTGTISASIGNNRRLQEVDCHLNFLVGSLPSTIMSLPLLYLLYLDHNGFVGEIPFSPSSTSSSSLSTSITSVHTMSSVAVNPVIELLLNDNAFTGTLSTSVKHYPLMLAMNLSTNHLTGTLPSELRELELLRVLDISNNHFIGSLTNKVDTSRQLLSLFVASNAFTGRLDAIFNSSIQQELEFVDVSDNALSGSLSPSFFQVQNLSSFAAVKNCLTGSIPETICNNGYLVSLALDGLHTSESCQRKVLPGSHVSSAYLLDNVITGSIPTCLFTMERLATLHLSGNGIEGTIPVTNEMTLSTTLTDLSLSHNALTGSIPRRIQEHTWETLDLSFNRLDGKLVSSINDGSDSSLATSSSITLTVNRLSGLIPQSLNSLNDIALLQGNLFGCRFFHRKEDLPKHDQYYHSYTCGSNSVDIPMILWAVLFGSCLLLVVIVAVVYSRSRHDASVITAAWSTRCNEWWEKQRHWWSLLEVSSITPTLLLGRDLRTLRQLALSLTGAVVCLFLPLYAIVHVHHSTHDRTYAWSISLAYLEGINPAALTLALFILLVIALEVYRNRYLAALASPATRTTTIRASSTRETYATNKESVHERATLESKEDSLVSALSLATYWQEEKASKVIHPWNDRVKWTSISIGAVLINLCIVLAVNAAYVYSTTLALQPIEEAFVTLAITLFKVIWSFTVVARWLGDILYKTVECYVHSSDSQARDQGLALIYEQRVCRLLVVLSLFNSVIAPCLAVLFVSPQCFLYVITEPPQVYVSYRFLACEGVYDTVKGVYCVNKTINEHSTSYSPAFSYGYQCTSSLLASFVDVYLYRYLITGLLLPLMMLLIQYWQQKAFVKLTNDESNNKYHSVMFRLFSRVLPSVMRIVDYPLLEARVGGNEDGQSNTVSNPLRVSTDKPMEATHNDLDDVNDKEWLLSTMLPSNNLRIFNARSYTSVIVGDLAILLTFGTIFPPLAVVVCISICLSTIRVQVLLGRCLEIISLLIQTNRVTGKLKEKLLSLIVVIQCECKNVGSMFVVSIAPITVLASLFWSFFLFDILGSDIGTRSALWILFVLPGCLLVVRASVLLKNIVFGNKLLSSIKSDKHSSKETSVQEEDEVSMDGIELRESSYQIQ